MRESLLNWLIWDFQEMDVPEPSTKPRTPAWRLPWTGWWSTWVTPTSTTPSWTPSKYFVKSWKNQNDLISRVFYYISAAKTKSKVVPDEGNIMMLTDMAFTRDQAIKGTYVFFKSRNLFSDFDHIWIFPPKGRRQISWKCRVSKYPTSKMIDFVPFQTWKISVLAKFDKLKRQF